MYDMTWIVPAAIITTVLLLFLLDPIARRFGLVDAPGGRKQHTDPVPLTGGLAMFAVFTAFLPMVVSTWEPSTAVLVLAMFLMLVTGIADDYHDLGSRLRLVLQVAVAVMVVLGGGLLIESLGDIVGLGPVSLGWLAVPFTLLCLVGLINAVNMIDGLDGLAGGITAVMLGWLALVAWIGGAPGASPLPLLLLAVVAGFLVLNLPFFGLRPAAAFMGDSGSMMLAVALGWFAIEVACQRGIAVPPMTLAWILALPILDTVCVMFRRMGRGRSPFDADREHIHHYLQWAGLSPLVTLWTLIGVTVVTGGIGVGGWLLDAPEWLLFLGFLLLGGAWLAVIEHGCARLRRIMRARRLSRA